MATTGQSYVRSHAARRSNSSTVAPNSWVSFLHAPSSEGTAQTRNDQALVDINTATDWMDDFHLPSFRIGAMVGLPAIPCRNSHTRSRRLAGMPKAGQTDLGASSRLLGDDVLLPTIGRSLPHRPLVFIWTG